MTPEAVKHNNDVLLTVIASVEIRIDALEAILKRKGVLVSDEEMENEINSQLKHLFRKVEKYHLAIPHISKQLLDFNASSAK
jgi:hypothetical protein